MTMRDGGTVIPPRSPSGEVLLPPNPRRTHGRSGRAALTAGTLSTVGDDVAGEDVKRYVEGRDADRDDANVMHGGKLTTLVRDGGSVKTLGVVPDNFTEREAVRQGRLRRWQATR